jgi:hypothetical protein
MSILSISEAFVYETNISATNVQDKEFYDKLSFTNEERYAINKSTVGQREDKTWFEMRHLMVTGTKVKYIYTRQKTFEKYPETDVTATLICFYLKQSHVRKLPPPFSME